MRIHSYCVRALVLVAGFGAAAPVPSAAQPSTAIRAGVVLSVEPKAIDFGRLPRFAQVERVVSVYNERDTAIALLGTGSDCACLTSVVAPAALAAGARTSWLIRLHTCEFIGEARRSVWIDTAGGPTARLRLAVRYHVVPELFVEPEFLALGVLDDRPIEAQLDVLTCDDRPYELLAARSTDPRVTVRIDVAKVRRDQPGRVHIFVPADLPEGPLRPLLWIETSCPALPRLRVPMFGDVLRGLRSDRSCVEFDPISVDAPGRTEVRLTTAAGLRIEGVRCSDETVDVERIDRDDTQTVLRFRSAAELPLGEFAGSATLLVSTRGAEHKVRLPYRGRVVEPIPVPSAIQTIEASASACTDRIAGSP